MVVLLIHITSTLNFSIFLYFSNQGVRELTVDLKGLHILEKVKNHWIRGSI